MWECGDGKEESVIILMQQSFLISSEMMISLSWNQTVLQLGTIWFQGREAVKLAQVECLLCGY